jgi:hypothetical protein
VSVEVEDGSTVAVSVPYTGALTLKARGTPAGGPSVGVAAPFEGVEAHLDAV